MLRWLDLAIPCTVGSLALSQEVESGAHHPPIKWLRGTLERPLLNVDQAAMQEEVHRAVVWAAPEICQDIPAMTAT